MDAQPVGGIMISHRIQTPLRHIHTDGTHILKDVRKRPTPELLWDQIYFVGFRIESETGQRYHHALFSADDQGSFMNGIACEYNAIRNQPSVHSVQDISLVFVRNLSILDPEVSAAAESHNITAEIRKELCRRDDGQFLVYGLISDKRICLLKVEASNALRAIEHARKSVIAQYQKELLPLEVCQPHPVTTECYALFDAMVSRVRPLIEGDLSSTGYAQ